VGRIEVYHSILGAVEDKKVVHLTGLSAPYISRIRKSLGVDSFSKNLKSLIKAYKVRKYRRSAQALREGALFLRAKEAGKELEAVLGISAPLSDAFWLYNQIDGRLKDENKMTRFQELIAEYAAENDTAIEPMVVEALLEFLARPAGKERRAGKKRGRKQRRDVAAISVSIADISIEEAPAEPSSTENSVVSASVASPDTEVSVDASSSDVEKEEAACGSSSEEPAFRNVLLFAVESRTGESFYVKGENLLEAAATLVLAGVEAVRFEEMGKLLERV
jgi:hypothetical protein